MSTVLAAALVASAAVAFAVAAPHTAVSDVPEPTTSTTPYDGWDERVAELACESWQVPGWLGEDGLPTSCVSNEANPGDHKAGLPVEGITDDPLLHEAPAPVDVVIDDPLLKETPAPVEVVTDPAPTSIPAPEKNGCGS